MNPSSLNEELKVSQSEKDSTVNGSAYATAEQIAANFASNPVT